MLHDVYRRRWRRLAITLGVGTVAALALPGAAAAGGCDRAGAQAADARRGALRAALVCLINRERAAHGLRALRRDRKLARAARRHARDMVRRDYFAHQRSGGPDLGARVRRTGWHGSRYGETIAYGCGSASTPRTAVRMWMQSPGHRTLILDGGFRRAGAGVVRRAPVGCGGGGATWVLDLGSRR